MGKTAVSQEAKTASFLQPAQGMLQRKCACGNQTVGGGECAECGKKKRGLQRKLTIGASSDPLEREADRIADQVIAAPVHSAVNNAPLHIQRYTRQASEGADTASDSVDRVLASSGRPLETALRQDMEQRFGHDFSQVRVHSGAAAEQSVRDVHAHAYTVGRDIVFGAAGFAPRTNEGRRLIAHELVHVVQQGRAKHATSGLNSGISNQSGDFLQRQGATIRSPFFEEAVTQVTTVAGIISGRALTGAERALAHPVFGNSIDYDRIRLVPTSVLEYRTIANNIMIPQNFSINDAQMAQTFIHELTHVWQYQHNGTSYISISLGRQISASIGRGNRNFAYDYEIRPEQSFFDFRPEQQASIVENYYSMLRDHREIASSVSGSTRNYFSNHMGSNGFRVILSAIDRQSEISRELPAHLRLIRQMQQALPRTEAGLLNLRALDLMQAPAPGGNLIPTPDEQRIAPIRPLLEVRF